MHVLIYHYSTLDMFLDIFSDVFWFVHIVILRCSLMYFRFFFYNVNVSYMWRIFLCYQHLVSPPTLMSSAMNLRLMDKATLTYTVSCEHHFFLQILVYIRFVYVDNLYIT